MNFKSILTMTRIPDLFNFFLIMKDWRAFVRMHFCYVAGEVGLLEAINVPCTKEDLIQKLRVERPELLDAFLDLGQALGEIACKQGRYFIKGRRSKSLIGMNSDVYKAAIEVNVSYYNAVYRRGAARIWGARSGAYLNGIGDVVARFSKFSEPFVWHFIKKTITRKESLRILDVGCGSGAFLNRVARNNSTATGVGIDIDQTVVKQAAENLRTWKIDDRFTVTESDIKSLPQAYQGPYDVITLFNVVYYFSPEDRAELFQRLRSMLSKNGVLAVVSSMQGYGKSVWAAHLDFASRSTRGCWELPELEAIKKQLKEGGFTRIKSSMLMPRDFFYGLLAG